jgi:hypothetical protein
MQKPFAHSSFQSIERNSFLTRRHVSIMAAVALVALSTIGITIVNAHYSASGVSESALPPSEMSSGMPLP